jgi:hypothetical protein
MDQTTPDTILGQGVRSTEWNLSRLRLWHSFCQRYRVGEDSVPLFECDEDGLVLSREIGTGRRRKILQRSSAMEALMRQEAKKAIDDHNAATGLYDGIIYMMHTQGSDGGVVPCYIGKSETVGRLLEFSRLISCGWRQTLPSLAVGATTTRIISEILVPIVLPGHDAALQREKCRSWATALFEGINTDHPRLRQPAFFWVRAWKREDVGI